MFGTIKNKIALAAVVAAGALAVPAAASAATAVPALPAGSTQAKASLTSGGAPVAASRTASGSLTLNGTGGVTVTCTITATIDFNLDGTTLVRNIVFTPTACPTSIPGCTATAAASPAPNNTWGNRLITWPGASGAPSGTYDIVNVSFQNTFSGTCAPLPTGVALTETGVVWFRVAPVAGGPITTAIPTAPNNVVTNPALGAATITGTLNVTGGALFAVM